MSRLLYNKTNWKDDETTPINARNLNNLEDGIEYVYEKWDEIISDATTGDHAAELIDARNAPGQNNKTLGQRLNNIDEQFNTVVNEVTPKTDGLINFITTQNNVYNFDVADKSTLILAMLKKVVNCVFWGDSITAGADALDDNCRYAYKYVKYLREQFPNITWNYVNRGIGGCTVENANDGTYIPNGLSWQDGVTSWRDLVKKENPDVIFLAFGMNAQTTCIGGVEALQGILDYTKTWTKKPTIILLTNMLPRYEWKNDKVYYNDRILPQRYTRFFGESSSRNLVVLDIANNYNKIVLGKDDKNTYIKANEINDFNHNINPIISNEVTYNNINYSKSLDNDILEFIFNVGIKFTTTSDILSFKFRNRYSIFIWQNGKIRIMHGSTILKEITGTEFTIGKLYNIEIRCQKNIIDVVRDYAIVLTHSTFHDFTSSDVWIGTEGGTVKASSFNLKVFKSTTNPKSITENDVFGEFVNNDYSTKKPYGGNGVNHPTSKGIEIIYMPCIYNFSRLLRGEYDKEVVKILNKQVFPYDMQYSSFAWASSWGNAGLNSEGKKIMYVSLNGKCPLYINGANSMLKDVTNNKYLNFKGLIGLVGIENILNTGDYALINQGSFDILAMIEDNTFIDLNLYI